MELGEKWPVNLACDSDFHVNRRDLLHAENLRHGTDIFTSPPKEGMLWFCRPKNPTASAGFEPAILSTRGPTVGQGLVIVEAYKLPFLSNFLCRNKVQTVDPHIDSCF
jgi:hypothetical protein